MPYKLSVAQWCPAFLFCGRGPPLNSTNQKRVLSRTPQWLANGLRNDLPMAVLGLFASHWGSWLRMPYKLSGAQWCPVFLFWGRGPPLNSTNQKRALSRTPHWLANGLRNDLPMAVLGLFASHWGVLAANALQTLCCPVVPCFPFLGKSSPFKLNQPKKGALQDPPMAGKWSAE